MNSFVFNKLTQKDIEKYADKAYVFNKERSGIMKEKVLLGSVSDDRFGSSEEKLDVAVRENGMNWELLDIEDKIKGYNEIPLGYVINDEDFDEVLVIIRRMSNFAFDEKNHSDTSYIYTVMNDEYKNLPMFPAVSGMLAANKIRLNKDFDSVRKDVEKRYGKDMLTAENIIKGIQKVMGEKVHE